MPHSLVQGADWSKAGEDTSELGRVYHEHVGYVWRCVRHLGVRSSDLEDVTHEVFLVIGRRLGSFEGRSSLKTWIYGICVRVSSDYRRKASFRRELPGQALPETAAADDPLEDTARAQLRRRLLAHLDALSSEQREVFVLYEIEELSMKEVADAVGCPLQTAYSRLHAARAGLKERLAREEAPQ